MTEPEQRHIDAASKWLFNWWPGKAAIGPTRSLARLLAETEAAQHERTKAAALGLSGWSIDRAAIRALTLADVNGGEKC